MNTHLTHISKEFFWFDKYSVKAPILSIPRGYIKFIIAPRTLLSNHADAPRYPACLRLFQSRLAAGGRWSSFFSVRTNTTKHAKAPKTAGENVKNTADATHATYTVCCICIIQCISHLFLWSFLVPLGLLFLLAYIIQDRSCRKPIYIETLKKANRSMQYLTVLLIHTSNIFDTFDDIHIHTLLFKKRV